MFFTGNGFLKALSVLFSNLVLCFLAVATAQSATPPDSDKNIFIPTEFNKCIETTFNARHEFGIYNICDMQLNVTYCVMSGKPDYKINSCGFNNQYYNASVMLDAKEFSSVGGPLGATVDIDAFACPSGSYPIKGSNKKTGGKCKRNGSSSKQANNSSDPSISGKRSSSESGAQANQVGATTPSDSIRQVTDLKSNNTETTDKYSDCLSPDTVPIQGNVLKNTCQIRLHITYCKDQPPSQYDDYPFTSCETLGTSPKHANFLMDADSMVLPAGSSAIYFPCPFGTAAAFPPGYKLRDSSSKVVPGKCLPVK